jgi:hypothetical protein
VKDRLIGAAIGATVILVVLVIVGLNADEITAGDVVAAAASVVGSALVGYGVVWFADTLKWR